MEWMLSGKHELSFLLSLLFVWSLVISHSNQQSKTDAKGLQENNYEFWIKLEKGFI